MRVVDKRMYAALRAADIKAASIVSWPRKPDGMVFHYDGAPYDMSIEQINESHKQRKFIPRGSGRYPYCGYHRVIRRDGSVHVGRTDDVIGTHVLGHNDHLFGVCLTGGLLPDFPTPAQYAAAVEVASEYMMRYGFGPDRLFRHDQLNRTDCPGRFDLHRVVERLMGGALSVDVQVHQIDLPAPAGEYRGIAVVDLRGVGNVASFEIKFPPGLFSSPPLLLLSQANSNTNWGAVVGSSDVTKEGARVYLVDRGKVLDGAHVGVGILAMAI